MAQFLHTEFQGDGEVRALLRQFDWSSSPLGPPSGWPPALATALNMVLDSAFPMFVAWGTELSFLYNDAYARIMGDKHPQALGGRFQRIWSEIWPDIAPIVDRALSGKPTYFEDLPLKVLRHGYPEQSYFTFSYSPLHDRAGEVGGMYCTVIETTDRVLAERRAAFELQVSDTLRPLTTPEEVIATASALLGEQLNLARVLYCEYDEARGTFYVPRDWTSPALASLAGDTFRLDDFSPSIGAALRAGDVVMANDTHSDPRTVGFDRSYATTGIRSFLAVPLVKGGRLVAFLGLNRADPYNWTDPDVRFAREMAERTWSAVETARAQGELRAERDRSRYIFDTITEGFVVMDRDWNLLEMNAEGLRITRRTAEEVVGRNHWDIWPEAVGTEGARMYQRVMDSREPGSAEYCLEFGDGNKTWTELRAYPTRDGGIAVFIRDITGRREAEEKLKAADQRKDEFLAMLAHELRNPLAPISAAAELLKIGKLDETRVRHSSAIIARQVKHMTSLVDDLLDVSRVTRGLVTLAKTPVTARTIVDEAVEQVRPLMQVRQQVLTVHLSDEDASVMGDKARLVQVMANLLNNAAKYSPEGRAIHVRADARGQELLLTVRDEGIGMAQELTTRVFDLFAQAERSSDRSLGGLGLGLALVKHLVELHGGSVACSSPGAGLGSTFVVALPLMRALPSRGMVHSAVAVREPERLKLMVVDDNTDAARMLGMLLTACGHEVIVEHASLRALERARLEQPDACLLDIGLPGMDGNELARCLQSRPETAGITLIAVTGYGQARDQEEALSAGFRHHLVKPVDMEKLAGVLAGIRG
jgi:PAS domain S-box-containing protein